MDSDKTNYLAKLKLPDSEVGILELLRVFQHCGMFHVLFSSENFKLQISVLTYGLYKACENPVKPMLNTDHSQIPSIHT